MEPGEKRDGKAYPLSKRHFPYKDASGKVDLAHLRNAIARIPQSNAPGLTPEKKRALQNRARKLLAEQSKSLVDKIGDALKSLFGIGGEPDLEPDAATLEDEVKGDLLAGEITSAPFTVWKAGDTWRWLAVFTNRYRDNDSPAEILTDVAHRDFEKAIDDGEWPLPELWPWHVPYRIGVADAVAYDDRGFMLATGTFDDAQVGERMAQQKDLGTSHGMPSKEIRRDEDDPTLIVRYRTREISPLRIHAAANPYTGFMSLEGKTMGMSDEKQKFLQEVLGDAYPKLEELLAGKAKEAEGVEFKEAEPEPEPEPQPVEAVEEVKAETPPPVAPITREEVADEIATLTATFLTQFERIVDEIAGLKSAVKEIQDADAQREKDLLSMTPAASLHSMVQSRVIGAKATKLAPDSELAKATPKVMNVTGAAGPTPVPLINAMMAQR